MDAMNGRPALMSCLALPLISFRFFDLPGEYPIDTAAPALWTADIDLGGSFGNSMVFEIGDTDSDLQGAAVHHARLDLSDVDSNGVPDIDIDEDGLADWGWSVQFIQPGTVDVDNADSDSDWSTGIDGDVLGEALAGVMIGSPTPGHAEFDSVDGSWAWVSDGPTAGATEDAFTIGITDFPDGSGGIFLGGPYWFLGLDCSAEQENGYQPAAHFQTVLYGPGVDHFLECGDLAGNPDGTPDGVLNFFDISAYLVLYAAGDMRLDIAGSPDGSPDGLLNFLDVSAYLVLFAAGCP
jgi:hypothetical protein